MSALGNHLDSAATRQKWVDCAAPAERLIYGGLGSGVAGLVGAIGRDDFESRLGELLSKAALSVDQVTIFYLQGGGEGARCLYSWQREGASLCAGQVERYLAGHFHTYDPALNHLRGARSSEMRMGLLPREAIIDDWYRRFFFEDAKLAGKLSILNHDGGSEIYQNFYNRAGMSAFSSQEIENFASLSEVVSQCVIRHSELTRPASPPRPDHTEISRLLARSAPSLTLREREVCARIVSGYTTEAIALGLGISTNSVATYRKRAYAKLGICSQHHLFLLCLGGKPG